MNTTVTVETVHGLKDTLVVGTSGIVHVAETASGSENQPTDPKTTAATPSRDSMDVDSAIDDPQ